MFGKRKKEKSTLKAPQTGLCISLDDVPDEVFSARILGDGIAVIPEENDVKSPANGTVVQVFDTLHAYSIRSDDGLEILVHIGINTVELKGQGFAAKVKTGDRVNAGDILCTADISFIKKMGYDICTPLIITNIGDVKKFDALKGRVIGGETPVIEYIK